MFKFPIFIEPHSQKLFTLYQLKTVPVPIEDTTKETNSYTLLQSRKNYLAMTEGNYISLTSIQLSTCKHIGQEYYCESIFLVKHMILQSCESVVFFTFHQTLLMTIVSLISFITLLLKIAILDAGDTLILSISDKPWYLHCNEPNNMSIPILTYDYMSSRGLYYVTNQSQGGNEFLPESLASYPSGDKVDRNIFYN